MVIVQLWGRTLRLLLVCILCHQIYAETDSYCLTKRFIERDDPVPLKSVSVDVKIEGFIAKVQSTLVYKNVEKKPIEARYTFPMDDQSVVYQFEAQVGDRIIIAECQEKKQAKETYDDAVDHGFGAVLLEEDDFSSDIFTSLVGNLPPDAEAVIKFGYVTELSLQSDGNLTFLLPTLLNPRYNPSRESGGSTNPPDVTYVPREGGQPYKFEISVTVSNPGKINRIIAAKDDLDVKLSEDKTVAQIKLAKPFTADHDFTLKITYDEVTKPHIIVEKGDKSREGILKQDVVMLNFFPVFKDTDYTSKHEFIFVIDQSGSMEGSRMMMAKETLLLFLKSLPVGCYFNIIGFGSNFQFLFPDGSREYSAESLETAYEYQNAIDADLGGTEILEPLKRIYEKPPMTTHKREILLLTDGEVMNTQAVIELVEQNAMNTRLFSFGIGEGASTTLVKGIARAGRGIAEFAKEGERLQPLVVKTLKSAMQVPVCELSLDWKLGGGSKDIVQLPKELPPMFAGERLIIYGVTTSQDVSDGKVQLKGKIGVRQLEFVLDVDSSKNILSKDQALPIHRLAAKAQIKQLQDAGKDENKDSIVFLSTSANVISCHTSMVGIDKNRNEKVADDLLRRNVPLMYDPTLTRIRRSSATAVPRSMAMRTSTSSSFKAVVKEECCGEPIQYDDYDSMILTSDEDFDKSSYEPEKKLTYMGIVNLQAFSGEWQLNTELAEVLGSTVDVIKSSSPVKALDVWATALALSYMTSNYSERQNEWDMIEAKARQWLDLRDREGLTVDELLEKAQYALDGLRIYKTPY